MTTSIDGAGGAQSVRAVVVEVRLPTRTTQPAKSDQESSSRVEAVDPAKVSQATQQVEELFQSVRRNLQFRDDPNSGRMVVSVIDADSGEIIRQIPPEQIIRMAASLEAVSGMLLGERA